MRNGDRFYPAKRGDQRFAGGIKISDAVPQNIPLRREQQKSALIDSKFRYRPETQQPFIMLLPFIHMRRDQIVRFNPGLSAGRDVLAFILTDTTMVQGIAAIVVRRTAGCAQRNHHISFRIIQEVVMSMAEGKFMAGRRASQGFRALRGIYSK